MSVTDEYLKNNDAYTQSFAYSEEDVCQSLRRIEASPFVTKHSSARGFVFDVATGRLAEVTA